MSDATAAPGAPEDADGQDGTGSGAGRPPRRRVFSARSVSGGIAIVSAVIAVSAVVTSSLSGDSDQPTTSASRADQAPGGNDEQPAVSRAAVRPDADSVNEAGASGVLRSDPATGCLWLEPTADAADAGARLQVLLQGDAYAIDFAASPAAVRHGDRIVARVGDHVRLGGGSVDPSDGVRNCPVSDLVFLGQITQ